MNTTGQIVRILADGPALTGEVAAELGIPANAASAFLHGLLRQGRVEKSPFKRPSAWGRKTMTLMWGLAPQQPTGEEGSNTGVKRCRPDTTPERSDNDAASA